MLTDAVINNESSFDGPKILSEVIGFDNFQFVLEITEDVFALFSYIWKDFNVVKL